MYRVLIQVFIILIKIFKTVFKSKDDLILENIALRQQLAAYMTNKVKPRIKDTDRAFWIAMRQAWSKWVDVLIIVKPETVIDWQRRRFKKHWTKISTQNKKPGRKRIKKEIRELIHKMHRENNWGAPKIFSELLKLGFTKKNISQSTVSRYLRKIKANDPDTKKKRQSWRTFLNNHREVIAAMDFFVVPAFNFTVHYVFFIIHHDRRELVHFNVTEHPTSQWVVLQLREAFPFDTAPKYLIFDRDKIFSSRVKQFITDMGIKPKQTSYRAPWQNGVAERYVLSIRTEMLNHFIIFNANQLRNIIKDYVRYYNTDRCHLSVDRDSPKGRAVQKKPSESAKVVALPRLGGLQHKYEWRNAA